jgi:hypothetical protein
MTHEEIKDYVIKTIRHGDRDRIKKVLERYHAYLKTAKKDLIDEAKDIFEIK